MPKLVLRTNEAVWIESSQRWQIKVQRNGKRPTFNDSTPGRVGKRKCEAKADEWLENQTEDPRFDSAWLEYLAFVKQATKSESYIKAESIGRIWLSPNFNRKRVSEISSDKIQEIIFSAAENGKSHRTCENIRAQMTAFYRFCKKKKYCFDEPEDIAIPTTAKKGKRKILQPNDVKTLFTIDTYKLYNKPVFAFFIFAFRFTFIMGFRRGETCGVRHEDITDHYLHVQRAINRLGEEIEGGKNENADRRLRLPKAAERVLADQERMLKANGIISPWVFPDENGNCLDSNHLYKKWRTYSRQIGINTNLHEIRHSAVSAYKADLPLGLMKPVLGHSEDMDTLGVYGHEMDGDAERAADIMDQVLDRMLK